jgi:Uma2 family endonuclease
MVDYAHLPGEEQNPLMESTLHVDWGLVLLNSARHTLANTNHLVTGNVAFAPADGQPHTAPDVMVIPNAAGREFGRYEPGPDDPLPTVCIEILSPSNTRADINRRCERLLRLGVPEVYVLDPIRETVVRVEGGDNGLIEHSAIGQPSTGPALTFATIDGHLAVCCPAGRIVRPGRPLRLARRGTTPSRPSRSQHRPSPSPSRNRRSPSRNRRSGSRIRRSGSRIATGRARPHEATLIGLLNASDRKQYYPIQRESCIVLFAHG